MFFLGVRLQKPVLVNARSAAASGNPALWPWRRVRVAGLGVTVVCARGTVFTGTESKPK